MFKYNTLSDLKDGTLTTPIRKEGEFIVCQNENGLLVNKLITDFDFAKKVEEREFVLASDLTIEMEKDLPTAEPVVVAPEPVVIETVTIAPEPVIVEPVMVAPEPIIVEPVVVAPEQIIVEPVVVAPFVEIKQDVVLPSNIKGKNIKVSVETQRF